MFAELHCKSHFSFLTGASSPQELVFQAAHLDYSAVSITDECSLAGVVKAHEASKECGIKLVIGSEFLIDDIETNQPAIKLVLLAPSRTAYAEISNLITKGRRRSKKGEYQLNLDDLRFGLQHVLAIHIPPRLSKQHNIELANRQAKTLKALFKNRLWFGVGLFWLGDDQAHYLECEKIAQQLKINMVACNDVHVHDKSRQALQDVMTSIRVGVPISELGTTRFSNGERYLKPLTVLQHQYPQALLDEALAIANLCHFSLDELRYEYPQELVPKDFTPAQYLRQLCEQGAHIRYPKGTPNSVQQQINYELNLISQLNYEFYF